MRYAVIGRYLLYLLFGLFFFSARGVQKHHFLVKKCMSKTFYKKLKGGGGSFSLDFLSRFWLYLCMRSSKTQQKKQKQIASKTDPRYLKDDPNFMEEYARSHTYVAGSKLPPKVIAKLASAAALRQLLANDGLEPKPKEQTRPTTRPAYRDQDPSIRKQQEPGSMNISTRPTTRPAYREQDLSTRKQQEPREPGSMNISTRPARGGNTAKAKPIAPRAPARGAPKRCCQRIMGFAKTTEQSKLSLF
jgi:hypothetical protein